MMNHSNMPMPAPRTHWTPPDGSAEAGHQPNWWRPTLLGTALGSGVLLLALVDPHQPGRYAVCPTLALFGVYCPGCGSLRATHNLTQLDLVAAWQMNPLLVLAVPYFLVAFAFYVRKEIRGVNPPLVRPWIIFAVAIAIALFGFLRNFSMFSFLAPH